MEAQAVIESELNTKIQELEQHDQELRSQVEATRKKLVDIEANKVIAFPATPSPQKAVKTAKKPRKPAEVPNKDVDVTTLMWDKPCCLQCGECENITTDRKPVFKPGEQGEADSYSQRWKCKKCNKTWTRKAVVAAESTTTSL